MSAAPRREPEGFSVVSPESERRRFSFSAPESNWPSPDSSQPPWRPAYGGLSHWTPYPPAGGRRPAGNPEILSPKKGRSADMENRGYATD
jgi:hypothetical protein